MSENQPLKFTEDQKRIWKAAFAPTATADQWALFIEECERRALIPNTHVVFSLRNANEWDAVTQQSVSVKKVAFITTINALRLLVDRYSDAHPERAFKGYGSTVYYYGQPETDDLAEKKVPLSGKIPHAVSVEVYRKDWDKPLFVVARYDACVQLKRSGNNQVPSAMWEKRGPEQTLKCAEASALRAIAPEELGGLYLKEELEASLEQPETAAPAVAPAPPVALAVPPVNQAPAVAVISAPAAANPAPISASATEAAIKPATPAPTTPATPAPTPVTPAPEAAIKPAKSSVEPAPGGLFAAPGAAVGAALPGPGLFANTTPPDPANETRPFPPAPVLDPLDKRLAAGEVGILKIPDSPDTRHAIPFVAADGDLPSIFFEQPVPASGTTVPNPGPAPAPVVPPAPPQPAEATPAPAAPTGPQPATQAERNTLNGRFARITRDTMPKGGIPEKQAGDLVKAYFARNAGVPFVKIPFARLTELLVALESAPTPEAAAKLVKGE